MIRLLMDNGRGSCSEVQPDLPAVNRLIPHTMVQRMLELSVERGYACITQDHRPIYVAENGRITLAPSWPVA